MKDNIRLIAICVFGYKMSCRLVRMAIKFCQQYPDDKGVVYDKYINGQNVLKSSD